RIEVGQQMRHREKQNDQSGAGRGERKGTKTWAGNASHGFSKNPGDAHQQSLTRAMTVERHGQAKILRAVFFETIESVCIDDRIGADRKSKVVTAELALVTDAGTDPPDSGMEEEKCFGDGL